MVAADPPQNVVADCRSSSSIFSIFASKFFRLIPIEYDEEDYSSSRRKIVEDNLDFLSSSEQRENETTKFNDSPIINSVLDEILETISSNENGQFVENSVDISTTCAFVRSHAISRTRHILPYSTFISTLPPVFATFSQLPTRKIGIKKKLRLRKADENMAAEVLSQNEPAQCFIASSSNIDRPFKLLVQKETFLIDAESMSRISPIFNLMCFGKDFEKMDLSREIVDEKSADIDVFLRAVNDTSMINSSNFALVLRLSNKYQVNPIIEACQQFIIRQHLDVLKPDEILTMLIAAYDHHCKKEVIQKLIRRLASEGNTTFTKLKISRYLPAQVYGSVISTSMNLNQVKEHEMMMGHVLKMERSKIRWRQSVCEQCKSVNECSNCDECKKTLCRNHVESQKCSSEYGNKLTNDLKKKIVDFEWND